MAAAWRDLDGPRALKCCAQMIRTTCLPLAVKLNFCVFTESFFQQLFRTEGGAGDVGPSSANYGRTSSVIALP